VYIRSGLPQPAKLVFTKIRGQRRHRRSIQIQSRLYVFKQQQHRAVRAENSATAQAWSEAAIATTVCMAPVVAAGGTRPQRQQSRVLRNTVAVGGSARAHSLGRARPNPAAQNSGGVVGYNLSTGIGVFGQSNAGIGNAGQIHYRHRRGRCSTNGIGVYGITQGANASAASSETLPPAALRLTSKEKPGQVS